MKIVCNYCKSEIDNCTNCKTGELKKDVTVSTTVLVIVLIICLIAAFRWYSALDDFAYAQKLRNTYQKNKLETQAPSPFTK